MKIIKKGDDNYKKPWWVGMILKCQRCGQIIKLEEGDHVTVVGSCEKCGCHLRIYEKALSSLKKQGKLY